MCGIYGFARKEKVMTGLERHKLRGMVMDLAFLNEGRGKDGTGIALLSASEWGVFKEALPSGKLLKTKRFQKTIRSITDRTLLCLGHTRLATVGSVSNRHCHPFVTEGFLGVHNGHFMNREELLGKHGRIAETEVDSEAIFRILDGPVRIPLLVSKLSEMQGDFALGFAHKANPYCLYLIRNAERPLSVAYVSRMKTLFWSSEAAHLEYALARNSLSATVWEIKEDQLYIADVRSFNGRSNMKKAVCKMPAYEGMRQSCWDEDDFETGKEPRLFSFEELNAYGCFQGSGLNEFSKMPCGLCRQAVEAGQLVYEEMSGKFLCECCSFDYLNSFTERRNNAAFRKKSKDLFEVEAF